MDRQLASLPDELLLEIFRFLDGDNKSLRALVLVSRRFSGIAEEILYRNITLDEAHGRWKTTYLLRTLMSRPDLALNVYSLKYTIIARETEYFLEKKQQLWSFWEWLNWTESWFGMFGGLLNIDQDEQLCGMQVQTPGGAVLSLLPNLVELDVRLWYVDRFYNNNFPSQDLFYQLFRVERAPIHGVNYNQLYLNELPPRINALRNVTRLTIRGEHLEILDVPFEGLETLDVDLLCALDGDYTWDGDQYSTLTEPDYERKSNGNRVSQRDPVRKYPSLSTLVVQSDWAELERQPSDAGPLVPGLIRTIGCTKVNAFEFILTASPRNGYWPEIYFQELVNSMFQLTHLESLKVDYAGWFKPAFLIRARPVTTFKHFTSLKNLEVLQQVLIHRSDYISPSANKTKVHDVLPASLETLTIICPDFRIVWWLEDLLEFYEAYPLLRTITLSFRYAWGQRCSQLCYKHYVFRALRKVGIHVKMNQGPDTSRPAEPDYTDHELWWMGRDLKYSRVIEEGTIWLGTWADEDWATALYGEEPDM